jgi:hypothetical protein
MKISPRIKSFFSKYPFATSASLILVLIALFIILTIIVAVYKELSGVVCSGLFGVNDSCVDVFQIGVTLIYYLWIIPVGRFIVLLVPLFYLIEIIRVYAAKLTK